MKAINRFIRYCDFKGIKPSRFEKNYGLSNGYFSVQLKRNGSLGEDALKIIIDNCREINPEWLITGHGNMLKNELGETKTTTESEQKENAESRLITENASLKETNDLLRFKIGVLEKELSEVKYTQRDPIIYKSVADTEPELKKKKTKQSDDAKK